MVYNFEKKGTKNSRVILVKFYNISRQYILLVMNIAESETYVFRFDKKKNRNSSSSDFSEIYLRVCLYFLFYHKLQYL